MPRKEPLRGERLVIVASGIERHFNDAFDVTVGRLRRADIHTETARYRRPDLFGVQFLSLDFTAFEHVGGEGLQYRVLAENEAKSFHVADQPTLPVSDGGQGLG